MVNRFILTYLSKTNPDQMCDQRLREKMSRREEKRYKAEEIIAKLREAEKLQTKRRTSRKPASILALPTRPIYPLRKLYGKMLADELKRLKELEKENGGLKRIVADLALDNAMLKEHCRRKMVSPTRKREAEVLLKRFATGYNEFRPYSALGYLTPREFADGRKQQEIVSASRSGQWARPALFF
jgi:transposase InsO family protein